METVTSDLTHILPGPTIPESPFSPLFISTATTYAPLLFIFSTASRALPFTSPLKPVPKMQSTRVAKPVKLSISSKYLTETASPFSFRHLS